METLEAYMFYKDQNELRGQLTQESAKQAFDELTGLGIALDTQIPESGAVYMSAHVKITTPDRSKSTSIMNVWAANADKAVLNNHEEIMNSTKRGNILVVHELGNQESSEFIYSKKSGGLTPVQQA